jgi:hypothetical protein
LISWKLTLLEPSELLRACTGIAKMEVLAVVLMKIVVVWSVDGLFT